MKNKKFQYVIIRLKPLAFRRLNKSWVSLKSGFLLLEILAALLALSTLSVLMAHYFVSIVAMNHEAKSYLRATDSANNSLDSWMLNAKKSEGGKLTVPPFSVERTKSDLIAPLELKAHGLTGKCLKKFALLKVNVSWQSMDGQSRHVQLESAAPFYEEAL